jgi:hypothetical protein
MGMFDDTTGKDYAEQRFNMSRGHGEWAQQRFPLAHRPSQEEWAQQLFGMTPRANQGDWAEQRLPLAHRPSQEEWAQQLFGMTPRANQGDWAEQRFGIKSPANQGEWAQQRFGIKPPGIDWLSKPIQPAPSSLGPMSDTMTGASTAPPSPGPEGTDPYLSLLYDMFNQAGQSTGGRAADVSGYNASLKMLAKERKRMKSRYKKYSGQIADIYGTLSGITQSAMAGIAPQGEAIRSQLSGQEEARVEATRSTENARLGTANEARSALGLEELAGEYDAGDAVTSQSEGMIADSEAERGAAENTLLANEAIAKSQGQNQLLGYGLQQEGSTKQLQTSLEDALAAIRAERANVLTARSQARSAAGGGSGPNLGAQMSILDQIQSYTNPEVPGEPSALEVFKSRYSDLAPIADQAADTFTEWVSTNYNTIPSVRLGKTPDGREVVNTFLSQIATTVPQAEQWARNNNMYNLLVQLASPPRK